MQPEEREAARRAVLERLGLSSLTTTAMIDIAELHDEHVLLQTIPGRFTLEGLTVEAPGGIYHPAPESSSEFFIRNMKAMDARGISKALEIGAGSGVISLFMAAHWRAEVTAADIVPAAIASTTGNAAANGARIRIVTSDLFSNIDERDFDFIVFNAPLVDREPENDVERYSLCDPGGRIIGAFLREAGGFIKKSGVILFGVCSNTAYEVFADTKLDLKILALELGASGFWRALVTARR